MKQVSLLGFMLMILVTARSQDLKTFRLYNPKADAKEEIKAAVNEAKSSGKNVLVQIGGNWCIWCARFNEFTTKDTQIDSLIKTSYVVYHLNYSEENKNLDILEQYRFPQRFGFPVFLVLNDKGELLHSQNSGYLESGKSYDKNKVMGFLTDWTPGALDPLTYKNQE